MIVTWDHYKLKMPVKRWASKIQKRESEGCKGGENGIEGTLVNCFCE